MNRPAIILFTLFSVLFLAAVGVATMLLLGGDEEPTATATPSTTPAPTDLPRATFTPSAPAPTTPQPTRMPRPTTTPAPTGTPPGSARAITAGNAAQVVEQGTIALAGANSAQNAIRAFAWSPDGRVIAAPEPANNRVQLFDAETRAPAGIIAQQDEPVRSLAFSPDGARLATGALEITVWQVETGEAVAILEGHTSPVLSLAFSPDGAQIVSTAADRSVRLWDAVTGEQQRQFALGGAGLHVAFSPDGQRVAAQGERIVRLWNAATGAEIATLEHGGLVLGMAFHPRGDQIATAAVDGAVRVWDAATGALLATLLPPNSTAQPMALAYSLDGSVLAVGRYTRPTLDLIDVRSGAALIALEAGPQNAAVHFSPDGTQLAALSGERGETLTVWGLAD